MTGPAPGEPLRTADPLRVRVRVLGLLLLVLLGVGVATSVRSARGSSGLANARSDDLVRVLDDLDGRQQRLHAEIDSLNRSRAALAAGQSTAAALADAVRQAAELGVLAGTKPARGPGITLTIRDPESSVGPEVLVDAIQELRDAGAEAIELSGVRLGVNSYVTSANGGLDVDGTTVRTPYRFVALGVATTLARAMGIPGGVLATVAAQPGAAATVSSSGDLVIRGTRALPVRRYARQGG